MIAEVGRCGCCTDLVCQNGQLVVDPLACQNGQLVVNDLIQVNKSTIQVNNIQHFSLTGCLN